MLDFSVLDVETTGLSPKSGHRVCEVGVVRVRNGRIEDSFQRLIDPCIPIPAEASAINGITQDMLEGAPFFQRIADDLLEFIDDDMLAMYNAPFDMSFLQAEMKAAERPPIANGTVDVLAVARRLLTLPRYPLWFVAQHLEISESQEHRALGDARIAAEVLLKLVPVAEDKRIDIGL